MTCGGLTLRDHSGAVDLPSLRTFAGACLKAHFPRDAIWHPGDVSWQLNERPGEASPIVAWTGADGEVAALLWSLGPGQCGFDQLPDQPSLIPEAVELAQSRILSGVWPGSAQLSFSVLQSDEARARRLRELGFARGGHEGVRFRRSLDVLPEPQLPSGMSVRDCRDIDPEARARCHRDAWNHLGHIGIEGARSRFSTEAYLRLRSSLGYDPSMDLVIAAEDGQLVANCICWLDATSEIGTFEPVGVHVDFRGRGLARSVVMEGLRRMAARGMRWARVFTAHFNAPAIRAYQGAGFLQVDQTSWWSRPLAQAD